MLMSTLSPVFRQENKGNKTELEAETPAGRAVCIHEIKAGRRAVTVAAGLLDQTSFSVALPLMCTAYKDGYRSVRRHNIPSANSLFPGTRHNFICIFL